MMMLRISLVVALFWITTGCSPRRASLPQTQASNLRSFMVRGILQEVKPDGKTAVIQHEAISNYMAAMIMPFKARDPALLRGVQAGDEISFRLTVTDEESWIDQISKIGRKAPPVEASGSASPVRSAEQPPPGRHPLLDYQFTNELGRGVSLGQFKGQALAISFFFTRCPIPDYCPRLSKNFEEASNKLSALPGAPTNWHFLSVSFDTEFDTPAVLRAYAARYHYDPKHWSFVTGPREKIRELATLSEVTIEPDGPLFNHSFRTLIIDAAGHLQVSFPIGGNLSEGLVTEILKAAAVRE